MRVLLALAPLVALAVAGDFNVYWNIPIGSCERSGVHFDLSQYGVIHNENNTFQGQQVNIWYRPGKFPYMKDGEAVNGGLPMEGDKKGHIESFLNMLHQQLNPNFEGISVIDFEQYIPDYDVAPKEYKIASRAWVHDHFPYTPDTELANLTRTIFNAFAVPYLQDLLTVHATAYPKALTGYYHYPYCKNYKTPFTNCSSVIAATNDKLQESIYQVSTALFPSVYISEFQGNLYMNYISTVLEETKRVNKKQLPVFPYVWYRFHEENVFLPKTFFFNIMTKLKSDADGAVLWGSSNDLRDVASCTKFKEYMDTVLGPTLRCLNRIPRSALKKIVDLAARLGKEDEEFLTELLFRTTCSE